MSVLAIALVGAAIGAGVGGVSAYIESKRREKETAAKEERLNKLKKVADETYSQDVATIEGQEDANEKAWTSAKEQLGESGVAAGRVDDALARLRAKHTRSVEVIERSRQKAQVNVIGQSRKAARTVAALGSRGGSVNQEIARVKDSAQSEIEREAGAQFEEADAQMEEGQALAEDKKEDIARALEEAKRGYEENKETIGINKERAKTKRDATAADQAYQEEIINIENEYNNPILAILTGGIDGAVSGYKIGSGVSDIKDLFAFSNAQRASNRGAGYGPVAEQYGWEYLGRI